VTESATYVAPLVGMLAADAELVEGFTVYQQSRSFSRNTWNRRRQGLLRFARHMAPASILTATTIDVEEYLSRLNTASTRKAYRGDIGEFFRWAVRRGLAESNPVAGTDGVKCPRPLPKPAALADITAAYAVADADTQLMLMLGVLAGLRISEIAALDATEVHPDQDPPVLVVREGKGGKDRVVPLHPTLVRMFATRPRSGWVFPARHGGGRHIGISGARRRIEIAVARAGVSFTAHQLRHAFGSETARWSKGNVVLVGALMGHAAPATTMGYIRPHLEDGADVISRISLGDELAERRGLRVVGA
jgi:integrase